MSLIGRQDIARRSYYIVFRQTAVSHGDAGTTKGLVVFPFGVSN